MNLNEPWHKKPWKPSLDWTTPTGELLRQAAEVLSWQLSPTKIQLLVFGSSPLQMGVSEAITSGDVDIGSDDDIETFLQQAELTKGMSSPYVEVCSLNTFRTALDWRSRCHIEQFDNVEILFPHPIDILLSKIRRGEEKDIEAFEEVLRKEGHPTEEELKDALQHATHLYRPGYDETAASDPIYNTERLWKRLFGREIDARQEIIIPGNQLNHKQD